MAPLVVPDVARFSINATYGGRPVANIIDMGIHTEIGTTRSDACEDQAKIIVSAWVDHVLGNIVNTYTATSVAWVDMDSLTGSTGEVTEGSGTDFPHNGELNSAGFPGSVSALVHKQITAGRGSRQGRMYLAGIQETDTTAAAPNTLIAGTLADMNAGFVAFLNAINQDGGLLGVSYDSEMRVVHTHNTAPDGEPVVLELIGTSVVSALVVDSKLATQRRRLR